MENIQKLTAVESEFEYIEDGKNCTIRKGKRDINLGLLELESLTNKRIMKVFVTHVIFCIVQNIPMEYVKKDGFVDRHDMINQMKTFYPNIDETTEVTIIVFN